MATGTMEPQTLAGHIRAGTNHNIAIVDVRDDDFVGGHIVGAINAPSESFYEDSYVDELIRDLAVDSSKTIVFHCMKSQVRGPKCARIFSERISTLPTESRPQVVVLRGGFSAWEDLFGDDATLVAN